MKLLPPTDGERRRLSRLLFCCALGFFVLGFLITFIPGGELGYFIFVACLFLVPMLIPRGGMRGAAAAFVFISLLLSLWGYGRGIQYQTWLAEHPINFLALGNETDHDLQHIEIRFGRVRKSCPALSKGEHHTIAFVSEPIAGEAWVSWDQDSIHHKVPVKLDDFVPAGFANGTVYFILDVDNSVKVKHADIRDVDGIQEVKEHSDNKQAKGQ